MIVIAITSFKKAFTLYLPSMGRC